MELSRHRLEELLAQIRAVQAQVRPPVDESASDGPDDDMRETLLDTGEDSDLLRDMLVGLGTRERQELAALMWIGRGDYDAAEWDSVLAQATETEERTLLQSLLGAPLVAEYVVDGYEQLRGQPAQDLPPVR